MDDLTSLDCPADVQTANVVLSTVLLIGIVVSYLPQHVRILLRKSSLGYSPVFLLLGVLGAMANMFNVICVQFSVFICCQYQTPIVCYGHLLVILQFIGGFLMIFILFFLYLCYYPDDRKGHREWSQSVIVFYIIMGSLLASILGYSVLISTFKHDDRPVAVFAKFNGFFAMAVVLFQYAPQIYKTWDSRSIGSLSILSMCIQTPGALLLVYMQYIQPNSDYTTWLPTLIAAILQGFLLLLCLYYQYFFKTDNIREIMEESDAYKWLKPPPDLTIVTNARNGLTETPASDVNTSKYANFSKNMVSGQFES